MSGEVVWTPGASHECHPGLGPDDYRVVDDPSSPLHGCRIMDVSKAQQYPPGTVWECGCGRQWLAFADISPGMAHGFVRWFNIRPIDTTSTRRRDVRRLARLVKRAKRGTTTW